MNVPDYILDTPPDDELAAGEQEEWETRRLIDESFIHIGRMDKTLDLMDEIADEIGTKPTGKWSDFVCPF